jgi:glycosyltransferase involved in cell wall biosynthesis
VPFFAPLWRSGPVVCLVHHVHTEQWRQHFSPPAAAIGRGLESYAMPAAYRRSLFLAVSPSTGRALEALGVAQGQIRVVTSGIDLPDAPAAPRSPEPLFLALGRLVPHKRIDLLLKLWDEVRPHTGGRLVVAGAGPELERVRPLAGPGVELRGEVSQEEKARLLASAWFLVHPAMHEGWGVVIIEAAAAGTPALAFDVPGVRDSVRNDASGVLARSEQEFVERWIRLAREGADRERLGEGARRWAAEHTWERTVDRFLAVLAEAVGRQSAGAPAVHHRVA